MTKIKSIPAEKVEAIIERLQASLKLVSEEVKNPTGHPTNNLARAVGYAQGVIELTIKQLKGDYPII